MKKIWIVLAIAALLVVGVTGCHTVHGAGQDIESVGESMQK
jgi:predicted small secreted protein